MILLDTNVVSELMRPQTDPLLAAWMDSFPPTSLFFSSTTVDEINYGLDLMPAGRRRDELEKAFSELVREFKDRVLPFDSAAAVASAGFRAKRRLMGRPMGVADSHIAGIAKSNDLTLATLNTRDFEEIALNVVRPR